MTTQSNATPVERLASPPAVECAEVISRLLDLLTEGAPADQLGTTLQSAVALLHRGDIQLEAADDELLSNGAVVAEGRTLLDTLTAHGVRDAQLSAETSDRELLHFLALLCGAPQPGGPTFAELWRAHGVWRVGVRHGGADTHEGTADEQGSVDDETRQLLATMDAEYAENAVVDDSAVERVAALVGLGWSVGGNTPLGRVLRVADTVATRALLDLLAAAHTGSERRRYCDAIIALDVGQDLLLEALSHAEWFVARNAATLLGDMAVHTADEALVTTLSHRDHRVRLASVRALAKLETPRVVPGLSHATGDVNADVRRAAWRALQRGAAPDVAVIDRALKNEDDPANQRELLACVRQFADLDVSAGLVRYCARLSAAGRPAEAVLEAVEILARRRAQGATPFLRRLRDHADPRIRARVQQLTTLIESSRAA